MVSATMVSVDAHCASCTTCVDRQNEADDMASLRAPADLPPFQSNVRFLLNPQLHYIQSAANLDLGILHGTPGIGQEKRLPANCLLISHSFSANHMAPTTLSSTPLGRIHPVKVAFLFHPSLVLIYILIRTCASDPCCAAAIPYPTQPDETQRTYTSTHRPSQPPLPSPPQTLSDRCASCTLPCWGQSAHPQSSVPGLRPTRSHLHHEESQLPGTPSQAWP
ncbi:hypothetical protein BS50DRAFT_298113 [Corynespora cassiicola Philippines]|uniref:Uncharacterized protein n=1 Tax=Corynespora cassiicola Philippines TaxID=1448308 RepID=A0A2T2NWU4_CORCC|nr:hypothetical protein BS50DRAFT_298113 [Corynespora cassiicola Philippines]